MPALPHTPHEEQGAAAVTALPPQQTKPYDAPQPGFHQEGSPLRSEWGALSLPEVKRERDYATWPRWYLRYGVYVGFGTEQDARDFAHYYVDLLVTTHGAPDTGIIVTPYREPRLEGLTESSGGQCTAIVFASVHRLVFLVEARDRTGDCGVARARAHAAADWLLHVGPHPDPRTPSGVDPATP